MPPKNVKNTQSKPKPKAKDVGIVQDSRFKHVHSDPRFVRPKKQDAKVKIDKRFSAMLKNKDFSAAPAVDKYGRKLDGTAGKDDLKRFYDLDDDEEKEHADSEEATSDSDISEDEENSVAQSSESESELDEQPGFDPMRGEGVSSSSEEESEAEEEQRDEEEEVPTGDDTCRFAVINLDWDNVKSVDLFKVFAGFKPEGGAIKSVKIYPSEFGKERLEKESREGPPSEIFKPLGSDHEDSEIEQAEEEPLVQADSGEEFDMSKLRKYQLERLKYYYAVVECDTVQTARAIYQQCDGTEYESSANFFDLRFIPDHMEFEDEPRDEAYNAPVGYKPLEFTTQALQHSKVKLTWDDDDVDRIRVTRQKFSKEDLEDMDFKAYIASSSDSNSDEDDVEEIKRKYQNLLAKAQEEQEDVDQDMEITFAPGLSEAASGLLERKKERENVENETSIETYMRKQKERRQKKKQAKKEENESEGDAEDQGQLFSDDEVNIDQNDPFFQSEIGEATVPKNSKKSESKNRKNKKLTAEERAEEAKKQAELELLVMDAGDGRKHFNMKDIIKKEKKGKKGKKVVEDTDEFEINVSDPRFTALHESHHFAIDPTNPQFKKTKSMSKLLEERQRRQVTGNDHNEDQVKPSNDQPKSKVKDASISRLVDSIKRKSTSNVASSGKRKKSSK